MKLRGKSHIDYRAIIAIVAAVLVIAIIGVTVFFILDAKAKEEYAKQPSQLVISYVPKADYQVGEAFDPKGIEAQVITNDPKNNYIVNYTDLTFAGFDSSVANDELKITVTYRGLSAEFIVRVREQGSSTRVYLTDMEICNLQTTYTLSDWNDGMNRAGTTLKLTYSDGTVNEIPLESEHVKNYKKLSEAGTFDLIIRYSDGMMKQETVTITITN